MVCCLRPSREQLSPRLTRDIKRLIIAGVQAGDVAMIRRFVEDGIALDRIRDYDGKSLMHVAAFECHCVVLEYLLTTSCTSQLNAPDRAGRTPLHLAAALGDADGVRILLRHGAFLNLRDEWGNSPLHLAAKHNQSDAGILLLQAGADTKIRNKDGHFPLDLCDIPDTLKLYHLAKTNFNDRKSLVYSRSAPDREEEEEEGQTVEMDGVELEERLSYRTLTGFLLTYLLELDKYDTQRDRGRVSTSLSDSIQEGCPSLPTASLSEVLPSFVDEDVVADLSGMPEGDIGVVFRWYGERYPALITQVSRDSVARKFGLREGDKIVRINDTEISCVSAKHLMQTLKQRPLILGIKRPACEVLLTLHRGGPLGLELRWHPGDRLPVVTGMSETGEGRSMGFLVEDQIRLVDEKRADKDFADKNDLIRTLQRTRPLNVKLVRWKNAAT